MRSEHDSLRSRFNRSPVRQSPVLRYRSESESVAAICTIPFNREGQLRQQKAVDGIEQLKGQADLLVTIPNEFIFTTAKPAPGILDMFLQMDELVLQVSQEILKHHETGIIGAEIQAIRAIEGATLSGCHQCG